MRSTRKALLSGAFCLQSRRDERDFIPIVEVRSGQISCFRHSVLSSQTPSGGARRDVPRRHDALRRPLTRPLSPEFRPLFVAWQARAARSWGRRTTAHGGALLNALGVHGETRILEAFWRYRNPRLPERRRRRSSRPETLTSSAS